MGAGGLGHSVFFVGCLPHWHDTCTTTGLTVGPVAVGTGFSAGTSAGGRPHAHVAGWVTGLRTGFALLWQPGRKPGWVFGSHLSPGR